MCAYPVPVLCAGDTATGDNLLNQIERASMLVEICASAVRLIGPCVFRSRSVFAPGFRGEFPFTKVVLSPYTVYDVSRLTYRSL